MTPTVLDLCGGTGSWSAPYRDAGYEVVTVTLPEMDVRRFEYPGPVHGILAAPPCDHFSVSGAQYWPAKDADGRTMDALSIADACARIILVCQPKWWAIENPIGRLKRWFGPPSSCFIRGNLGTPTPRKPVCGEGSEFRNCRRSSQ